MNRSLLVAAVLVAVLGATGGFLTFRAMDKNQPVSAPQQVADLTGQRRPDYSLGSSDGSIVSAADFDGQVVLLNFWATWCQPCTREMPMLDTLHRGKTGKGFTVLGVAVDDVQRARDFAGQLGVSYPILLGAQDVLLVARDYGNLGGLLPYSVLIGRDGIIRWTYLGELEEADLRQRIDDLL